MKANKVLERLEITRRTLSNYVSSGKIRVRKLENGFYEYNDEDVEELEKNTTHKDKLLIFLDDGRFEFNLPKERLRDILHLCIDNEENIRRKQT